MDVAALKKYFGISDYSPEKRWNNGEGYLGSFFYEKGILNFGWDNFEHLILVEDISKDLAAQIEARLIKEFETTNPEKGYNQTKHKQHILKTRMVMIF